DDLVVVPIALGCVPERWAEAALGDQPQEPVAVEDADRAAIHELDQLAAILGEVDAFADAGAGLAGFFPLGLLLEPLGLDGLLEASERGAHALVARQRGSFCRAKEGHTGFPLTRSIRRFGHRRSAC